MNYTPPPIHSFPPFYTLQPNSQTKAAQVAQWKQIVLNWAQEEAIWCLDQQGAPLMSENDDDLTKKSSIFSNTDINRSVQPELLDEIYKSLIKSGNGTLIEENSTLQLWPKSITYYADSLHDSLENSGITNTMLTLYELANDYTNLPKSHLIVVLEQLQKSGFLKIVRDDDNRDEILGIKVA